MTLRFYFSLLPPPPGGQTQPKNSPRIATRLGEKKIYNCPLVFESGFCLSSNSFLWGKWEFWEQMQLSIMDLEDRVMRWEIYEEEEKITHRLLWAPENPSLERGERETIN